MHRSISILFISVLLASSPVLDAEEGKASCVKTEFGKTADGQTIDLYTMQNRQGIEVQVMNYGATIV